MPLLYKYRAWNDYSRSMLKKNEFYFAPPNSLNDPFDGHFEISFKGATRVEKLEKFAANIKSNNPALSDEEAYRVALKEYPPGSRKRFHGERNPEKFSREIRAQFNNSYGIFSLTEDPSNILMWTHYADNHSGICVGLDSNELDSFIHTRASSEAPTIVLKKKVKYLQQRPGWNFFKDDSFEKITESWIAKSANWEYEREHRLLLIPNTTQQETESLEVRDRTIVFPSEVISEVILGLNTSAEDVAEIKTLTHARDPKPILKKAERDKDGYNIILKRVN